MACCVMGATYQEVIRHCRHIGVSFLFGELGSFKTEAIWCVLALFGFIPAWCTQVHHDSCCYRWHQQESPRDMGAADHKTHTTIQHVEPGHIELNICVLYHWYLPTALSKWKGKSIHTLHIPFLKHRDEPNAIHLFSELVQIRDRASALNGSCSEMLQWVLQLMF